MAGRGDAARHTRRNSPASPRRYASSSRRNRRASALEPYRDRLSVPHRVPRRSWGRGVCVCGKRVWDESWRHSQTPAWAFMAFSMRVMATLFSPSAPRARSA